MTRFDPNDLIQRYQAQFDAANAANEERYGRGLDLIQEFGKNAIVDLQRTTAERRGQTSQSLIDRGLHSSTVFDALQRRHDEEQNRGMADIRERQSLLELDWIEGRHDVAPDFNNLLSLLQQYGQGSGEASGGRENIFGGVNPNRFSGGGQGDTGGGSLFGPPSGGGGGSRSSGTQTFTNPGGGANALGPMNVWDIQQRLNNPGGGGGGSQTTGPTTGPNGEPYYVISGTYGDGWSFNKPANPIKVSGNTYYVK